jgi:hypothetical protein
MNVYGVVASRSVFFNVLRRYADMMVNAGAVLHLFGGFDFTSC